MPQVCVVAGASRGLGAAVAQAVARRGTKVALLGRTEADLRTVAESIGDAALPIAVDVTDAGGVEAAFASVTSRLGTPDCLVQCAAILGPVAPLTATEPDAWLETLRVNTYGAYLCLRAALRAMQGAGRGVILGVTSGGTRHILPWHSAYGTSKAAFEHLHLATHAEAAGSGIAIALFDPGGVDTLMMAEVRDADFPDVATFRRLHRDGALRPPSRVAEVISAVLADGVEPARRYHVDDLDPTWTGAPAPS